MRWVAVALVVWAGPVLAGDWVRLTGPEIAAALTARTLGYADGTTQEFRAGGVTIANGQAGRWTVEGDRYCSAWPPGDGWTCYGVERAARGLDIRFTDDGDRVTVGRYVDLQ